MGSGMAAVLTGAGEVRFRRKAGGVIPVSRGRCSVTEKLAGGRGFEPPTPGFGELSANPTT